MTLTAFRFGTVGAPKSTPMKPGGSAGAIIHLRSMALDAFELGWVHSVRVSEKTCSAIKAASEEHNVALSIHAPYFINLNADNEEWPKSRKRLMDAAHYGYLAGATDIIFPQVLTLGNPQKKCSPLLFQGFRGASMISERFVTRLHFGRRPWAKRPCWDH
jgi:deoxyribonuclease-4